MPATREDAMKLRKLAKDAGSEQVNCPALYIAEEDLGAMVAQGKHLDADTTANLEHLADDETAVRIPAETVLRAAGRLLAEHGRPGVAAEIEVFLREQGQR
jgi:hypothetical protein